MGLWMISGMAFWGAFVALGLRFRTVDEADGPATSPDAATPRHAPSRATPEHVLARSRR